MIASLAPLGLCAYIAASCLLAFYFPQSVLAFLLVEASLLLLYYMPVAARVKIFLGALVLLVLVPFLGSVNGYYLEVAIQIGIYVALALGLNIVVGFVGLLNLGFVAFYAIGAYLWAVFGSPQANAFIAGGLFPLSANWFFVFLLLSIVVGALTGVLLGLPVLRVRGDYLAVVTLGFAEVVRALVNNLDKPINLTNGPQGITPIQRPPLPPDFILDPIRQLLAPVVGHAVTDAQLYNVFFYFLALIVILIAILVARRLEDSRIGRAWTAIREDETAAIAMGIPLVRLKLAAFAAGASFAGCMGVLYGANRTFVSPETFSFLQSIGVLTMVILGGLGSIPGVIFGAAVVVLLNIQILQNFSLYLSELRQGDTVIPIINFAWKNLSNQLDPAKYQKLVFGIILVVMMIYRPSGLIPAERRQRELAEETE